MYFKKKKYIQKIWSEKDVNNFLGQIGTFPSSLTHHVLYYTPLGHCCTAEEEKEDVGLSSFCMLIGMIKITSPGPHILAFGITSAGGQFCLFFSDYCMVHNKGIDRHTIERLLLLRC